MLPTKACSAKLRFKGSNVMIVRNEAIIRKSVVGHAINFKRMFNVISHTPRHIRLDLVSDIQILRLPGTNPNACLTHSLITVGLAKDIHSAILPGSKYWPKSFGIEALKAVKNCHRSCYYQKNSCGNFRHYTRKKQANF